MNADICLFSRLVECMMHEACWARRNVYSAPPRYYKCTATHGTPRETHGGPRSVVQQIPKGWYNTQGGFDIFRSQISYSCSYGEVLGKTYAYKISGVLDLARIQVTDLMGVTQPTCTLQHYCPQHLVRKGSSLYVAKRKHQLPFHGIDYDSTGLGTWATALGTSTCRQHR